MEDPRLFLLPLSVFLPLFPLVTMPFKVVYFFNLFLHLSIFIYVLDPDLWRERERQRERTTDKSIIF